MRISYCGHADSGAEVAYLQVDDFLVLLLQLLLQLCLSVGLLLGLGLTLLLCLGGISVEAQSIRCTCADLLSYGGECGLYPLHRAGGLSRGAEKCPLKHCGRCDGVNGTEMGGIKKMRWDVVQELNGDGKISVTRSWEVTGKFLQVRRAGRGQGPPTASDSRSENFWANITKPHEPHGGPLSHAADAHLALPPSKDLRCPLQEVLRSNTT